MSGAQTLRHFTPRQGGGWWEGWRGTNHHLHKRSSAAAEVLRGSGGRLATIVGLFSHDSAGVKRKVAGRLVQVKPGSEGVGHIGSSDPGVSLVVFRQNVSDDVQT